MSQHVILVGFMGAGKTTVGRILADSLGRPFFDLDALISQRAGRTVADIFDAHGEATFRALEHAELADLVDGDDSVIACGGGVVVDAENRRLLHAGGFTVYLRVSADIALERIGDTASRPLLSASPGGLAADALLASRENLYCAVADLTIDTIGLTPREVADAIVTALQEV